MIRRLHHWLLALLLLSFPAAAQNRAEPVPPSPDAILDGYEANVRLAFREAYEPGVEARAVVIPSFQPEYAVGLRRSARGHEIFLLRPSVHLWAYASVEMMRGGQVVVASGDRNRTSEEIERVSRGLPPRVSDVPVASCAAAIDEETAAALLGAWRRLVQQTGPDQQMFGFDGVTYRFSTEIGGRPVEVQMQDGMPPQLADAMARYCPASRRSGRIMLWAGSLLAALSLVPAILLLSWGFQRVAGRQVPGMARLGSVFRSFGVSYVIVSIILVSLLAYAVIAGMDARELLGLAEAVAPAR